MYRHCIYCSADLGANESVEAFPVGRTLAFDAAKGRLWAVCGKCARWNLAPIEERWEAVEGAERHFRDTRLRVQSENIGLAKLRDGTRLIRVGAALAGELAVWRYGGQAARRRVGYVVGTAVAVAASATFFVYSPFGALATVFGHSFFWSQWKAFEKRRVVHTLAADETPLGKRFVIRERHFEDAWLRAGSAGEIELHIAVPDFLTGHHPLVLDGALARRVMERGLVRVNDVGASRRAVDEAVGQIAAAGSAEEFVLRTAVSGKKLEIRRRMDRTFGGLVRSPALALEMALHEEQERRAMLGELSILEAAWRDAEEIAGIADRLAVEPG